MPAALAAAGLGIAVHRGCGCGSPCLESGRCRRRRGGKARVARRGREAVANVTHENHDTNDTMANPDPIAQPSKPQSRARVLLVDDEAAIRKTFRYCLEDAGCDVTCAESAELAENLVQRVVFDVCLLDLKLGNASGIELLPALRAAAPWLRVVMVTAHSSIDNAVEAMRAGASDYLVKPCSCEQLRLAVDRQ